MSDAGLIENIRVPARDIGDHDVSTIQARQFWRGKKALGAQKEDVLPQPGPRFAEQIQENAEAG